jgi:hypothetical protein
VYGLPERAMLPSRNNLPGWLVGWGSALVAAVGALLAFRWHRMALPEEAAAVPARGREPAPGREEA